VGCTVVYTWVKRRPGRLIGTGQGPYTQQSSLRYTRRGYAAGYIDGLCLMSSSSDVLSS